MRIISCASYHGTGSSAITDYISEFDNCYGLTDYEFRFVQDPNGISDLEYNLVENHHRLNSGYALKKYKKMVDFLSGNFLNKKYEPFFDNKWKACSYEYIDKLTDFSFRGYWHQDVTDKGYGFYFRKRLVNKLLKKTVWRKQPEKSYIEMPKEITLCSRPTEDKFLRYTREYIDKLFMYANKSNKSDIMVDQIVPPTNLNRYLRYFNDIKVFVVERDPRDLYILEKYIWNEAVFPVENPEIFCKWYKYTREHRKHEVYDESRAMFVQFEDMVYKYDETTEKIRKWLGYTEDSHVSKQKFFVPAKSIKNTRLWETMPELKQDIEYIEKELKEYLYRYEEL